MQGKPREGTSQGLSEPAADTTHLVLLQLSYEEKQMLPKGLQMPSQKSGPQSGHDMPRLLRTHHVREKTRFVFVPHFCSGDAAREETCCSPAGSIHAPGLPGNSHSSSKQPPGPIRALGSRVLLAPLQVP